MLNFFFDFHGRIRRTSFFLGALATWIVGSMFSAHWLLGLNAYGWRGWDFDDYGWRSFDLLPWGPGFWLISLVVGLACFWAHLALAAKRWHDAGASGWLALLSLFPPATPIVFLILCLIPPTHGANQYGADPRATPVAA